MTTAGEAIESARAHAEKAVRALPPEFLDRCRRIIPEAAWEDFLASFSRPRNVALRVNTLRISPQAAREALLADGLHVETPPFLPEALLAPPELRNAMLAHPLAQDGLIHAQGLSSQLATLALDPRPGHVALDLCAAPGGKTSHIWQRMRGEGRLIAIEAVKKRFFKLRGVLTHLGMEGVETRCADGRSAWRWLEGRCDRVMLDAPCSSEARFRADDPATFRYWSPRKIKEMRRKQRGLIRAGIRCLKPGGLLLYATCSFSPEENESVIADAIRVFGSSIRVLPLDLPGRIPAMPGLSEWAARKPTEETAAALRRAARILPGDAATGFFLCLIRREA